MQFPDVLHEIIVHCFALSATLRWINELFHSKNTHGMAENEGTTDQTTHRNRDSSNQINCKCRKKAS